MYPKLIALIVGFLSCIASLSAQGSEPWDLEKCIEYALENNLQIKQQSLNVRSSSSILKQSKASRLPNLNGSTNFNGSVGYVNDPFTNEFDNQTIYSQNVSLNTNVNIYSGLQTTNTIKQNRLNLKADEYDLQDSENDIMLQVVTAYVNILLNQELVASAEAQLQTSRERRDRTEKLVKAGTLAVASLLDIESQIATEELQLVNNQNLLAMAYLTLQQLMTLDPDESFDIQRPTVDIPENNMSLIEAQDIYRTALGTQPDIKAAELRISGADYGIKVAKGGRLPSLGAGASVFTGYSSVRDRITFESTISDITQTVEFNGVTTDLILKDVPGTNRMESPFPYVDQIWENRNFGFGATLSIPIYNRGFNINQIQLAEIARDRARYNSDITKQALKQNIQQAYLDMQAAYSTYSATQKQISALETTFTNTEKQFNVGVLNSVDYLQAKNNLARAQNDLVRTKYDYIFRSKILDFYAGNKITLD